ncbi:hypothetical protein BDW42DRAFT_162643 [Aspergillus taichungensis]|uniref:Uncharacterized protein n=1 Tax=Aspergillus taichungensis TaxID=482145 RepID=A0A2J5I3X8_9EURO|nr:hypothetical protein BDW42DRAFT_162643 [Aspergillus taichungensis]
MVCRVLDAMCLFLWFWWHFFALERGWVWRFFHDPRSVEFSILWRGLDLWRWAPVGRSLSPGDRYRRIYIMEHPYPPDPPFNSSKFCKNCFPRHGSCPLDDNNENPPDDNMGDLSDDDNAGPSGSDPPPGGGAPPDDGAPPGGGAPPSGGAPSGRDAPPGRGVPSGSGISPGLWRPPGHGASPRRGAPPDRRNALASGRLSRPDNQRTTNDTPRLVSCRGTLNADAARKGNSLGDFCSGDSPRSKTFGDISARGLLGATRTDHSQGTSSQHPVHPGQAPTKDDVQQQSSSNETKKLRAQMIELLYKLVEDTICNQRDSAPQSKPEAEAPSENAKSETPVRKYSETKASHNNVAVGGDATSQRDSLYDSSIKHSSLQGNDVQHKGTTSEPSSSPKLMFNLELKQRRNSENAPAFLPKDLDLEYGAQKFDGSNKPSHRPSRGDAYIEDLAFPGDDEQPVAPRKPWALTQQPLQGSSEPSKIPDHQPILKSRHRSNNEDRAFLPEDPDSALGPQRFDGNNGRNHPSDSSECSDAERLFLCRPSALRRVSADQKPLTTQMSNAEAYGMSSVRAIPLPTRPSVSLACNQSKRNPGVDSQCTPS